MRSVLATLFLVLVPTACSQSSPGSDGGLDAGPDRCLGSDAAVCGAMGCDAITGWRSTGAPSVIDGGGEYAGCAAPNDLGCGQTFTCATAPIDGACWLFRNTCLPQGWQPISCRGDPSLYCPSAQ